MKRIWTFGRKPSSPFLPCTDVPDWQQASPRWIRQAVGRACARPTGGWYVVDAVDRIGQRPRAYRIAHRDLVAWRAQGRVWVAPDACPHLGAPLHAGRVEGAHLVCPWHGLALGPRGHGAWRPLASYDDGMLLWVRLETGEAATAQPCLPRRPHPHLAAVIRLEARCAPEDILANRLDPWHGVYLHPHAFARLHVLDRRADAVLLRVVYRVAGPLGVEVDAEFSSPDARTVVMTIVSGEGEGSIVETHATPVEPGRTAVTEAVLVRSDRAYIAWAMRAAAPLLRPVLRRAAQRLWVDDAAYAERRRALRGCVEAPLPPDATANRHPEQAAGGECGSCAARFNPRREPPGG